MFVRVNFFGIESKSKKDFEKGDMHVVITIELTTIVSPIIFCEPKLVYMCFHMDSIRKVRSSFQNRSYTIINVIIVGVRQGGNNKGEKQLLIVDGECEFDQDVFAFGNHFKIKYEQLLKAIMEVNVLWY